MAGVVQIDELAPFSFDAYGGTVSGTVQVRVVRSNLDGTMDFYWRIFNDATSAGPIGSFRFGGFTDSFQNVNFRIDGLGEVDSISAWRFSGAFDGSVNFDFGDALTPGSSSKFFSSIRRRLHTQKPLFMTPPIQDRRRSHSSTPCMPPLRFQCPVRSCCSDPALRAWARPSGDGDTERSHDPLRLRMTAGLIGPAEFTCTSRSHLRAN